MEAFQGESSCPCQAVLVVTRAFGDFGQHVPLSTRGWKLLMKALSWAGTERLAGGDNVAKEKFVF